jgi:hypothetical protein
MSRSKKVAVVIPVYKTQLTAYEIISLERCKGVLGNHPIIFVKPESLNIDALIADTGFSSISFDDHYFESVHGYNELMMAEAFYNAFTAYEYILIYQLDAFVFSDELNYWCEQGYDYIGAPWLRIKPYKNAIDKVFTQAKNYLYMRYDAKYKDGMPKVGKQIEDRVGNGGLSLRRVNKFAACCVQNQSLINHYITLRHPWFNEDIFWSIALNRKKQVIKKPPLKLAVKFSVETNPQRAFSLNNNQLPFGCHGWDKQANFWRPVFKGVGVDI